MQEVRKCTSPGVGKQGVRTPASVKGSGRGAAQGERDRLAWDPGGWSVSCQPRGEETGCAAGGPPK